MSHAYRSGGTFFDLSKTSVYYKNGQLCAHGHPESTFCETEPFRL